jgi:hypothetical protein
MKYAHRLLLPKCENNCDQVFYSIKGFLLICINISFISRCICPLTGRLGYVTLHYIYIYTFL